MKKSFRIFLGVVVFGCFWAAVIVTAYYVAAYHDKDDPVVHDDSMRVNGPKLPQDLNGYYYLLKAKDLVVQSDNTQLSNQKLAAFLEKGDPATAAALKNLIKSNEGVLRLCEMADRCQRFQKVRVNSMQDPFWHYRWLIDLERLRINRAYYWFHEGKEKQAFNELFHVIALGRRCEDSDGSLTTVAAGITFQRMGWKTIRVFLAYTRLDESTLLDFLQASENFTVDTNGMGNAFRLEYLVAADVIDQKAAGKIPLFYEPFPELPHARILLKTNRTKNKMVDRFQELIDDTSRPFEQQLSRQNEHWQRKMWPVLFTTNPFGEASLITMTYGWDLALAAKCVANVDGAATQTLLALKAWQVKNHDLPDSLDALAPRYIDHLPLDDFTGQPLLYSKSRKVIWASIEQPPELDRAPAGFSTIRDDSLIFRIPF